jgi:hypothetical protein
MQRVLASAVLFFRATSIERAVAVVMALAATLLAPCALAAQAPRHELDYRAPAECPDATRFSDEVAARVGYPAFGAGGERVELRILRDESGGEVELIGTLTLGELSRAFRDTDCTHLVGAMADVLAARLAANAASPAQSRAPMSGRVRIRVAAADGQRLTLHRVTGHETATIATSEGTAAYGVGTYTEPVCEAPCDAELNAGSYQFAVSGPGTAPLAAPDRFRLESNSELVVGYNDRSALRMAGWFAMLLGGGGGLALSFVATFALPSDVEHNCFDGFCGPQSDAALALTVTGAVVGAIALITGLVLSFQGDSSTVSVRPQDMR